MKKVFYLLILNLICVFSISAQSLPDEMYFSPDGRILYTGGRASTGFYDPTTVKDIHLNFAQSNYWTLLQQGYTAHTDVLASFTYDGTALDSVGVRFKGMTSYMGSGSSQKKSFNITTDSYISGQDIHGYNITNLNNCFQDASFLREVFYTTQIRKHIPAAKSTFVKLYINGENWGVYPNVQQLNKDFLKEWFMNNNGTNWRADKPPGSPGGPGGGWGDGTAALNYHTNDTADYQTYYTLKSSNKTQPWDDLVTVCHVLDTVTAANMETVLANYLDIDRTLWHLGSEILFSDDDSYVYKGKMDYYVYYDEATGRVTPLEYDGNSAMESNFATWSPFYNATNANYPLLYKLLSVPSIRQRYLAHMRTLISEELDSATAIGTLDNFHNMIDTMVQNDPKKLYTYANFNSELDELKDFIINRRNYLNSNTEVSQVAPLIADVDYYSAAGLWTSPVAGEDVNVVSHISSTSGIDHVALYYATGIYGKFEKTLMFDDGAHNDSAAADGIFGGEIPGQASGQWVRFYVEAVSSNASLSVSYSPVGAEHNVYVYQVTPSVASNINVTINEVMASNSTTAADDEGQYDDWIEFYNLTNQPQDISGYFLTDNSLNLIKWEFPAGTIISPNDYLIVWADEDGGQGALHTNFKLSGSGEHLQLLNPALEIVDDITFGTQTTDMGFARSPNGTGSFVIQAPTFSANNNTSSVNEFANSSGFITAYPNPANDHLKIYMSSSSGPQKLNIYNSIGGEVENREFQKMCDLDISDWPSGIYVIRVGNSVKRIVVQH